MSKSKKDRQVMGCCQNRILMVLQEVSRYSNTPFGSADGNVPKKNPSKYVGNATMPGVPSLGSLKSNS